MKSLRLFLEDASKDVSRDASLEKLKSKRAKAAERAQKTRDEFQRDVEERKKRVQSEIDDLVKTGEFEREISAAKAKKEKERVASVRANKSSRNG